MQRFLSSGKTISLTTSSGRIDFLIEEVVGLGGSCIAYKVKYFENENIPHVGILKEYCPAFLEDTCFYRNGTSISIPENMQDRFLQGLEEFKRTYRVINEYLSNNLSAANYHTVQIGLFEGNNTAYTLTSCDYGMSYDKIDNENLLSICKTMLSVTKAVELYHNAGFLHLDIKPKNILVLNDVTDLVKLFDFDSLTSIEKLKNREILGVPVPEDYYVPELESCNLRNIGIETDIFEIGAMLFLKVFKRAPEVSDMSYDSTYDIDKNPLFLGVSPQAKNEFIELFRNTIQVSKRNRYKTTKELKNKFKKIISLISDEKPYLLDLPRWQPSKHCIGRKDEIKEIKRRLDDDGYVFVKGIGGLGKSEVAKLFAEQYKNDYHTIQFCKFTDNLKTVLATMPVNGIDDHNYSNADQLINEKYKVLQQCDSQTLIIVDNFNVTYDDFLRDFLPPDNQHFKVIFTTRCTMEADYLESKTYELPKLSGDECKTLFFAHLSTISDNNAQGIADELIKFVDYNTLIIILMAIAIKKSGLSLNDMLSKLEEQKIDSIEAKVFHEYDFSSDEVNAYNKIYSHLSTIFSISNLNDVQKEILKNATLISLNGIDSDEFITHCNALSITDKSLDDVVDMGWLYKDANNVITMHPIVSDMFSANDNLEKKESYYNFSDYLEDFSNPDYCHFSVVLNKLACAKHLYRRYKIESRTKEMMMSAKLGRMYKHIYQPIEAKKYLKQALEIASELKPENTLTSQGETVNFSGSFKNSFIAYIYSFLGEIEKDFGIKSKAIEYYQICIDEGKKIKNRFYYAVIEAMLSIGECYSENKNNTEAYISYLTALNYAKIFKLYDYIPKAANCLVDICKILDWKEKRQIYTKVVNKYSSFNEPVEELPGISELAEITSNYDFEAGLTAYEKVLAFQREELGEDSPMYKDLKKGLWSFYAITQQKEQAFFLLNEALSFIESTSGENSIEMAKELSTASTIMIELTEFENAENFAKRAIKICEEINAVEDYTYVEALFALSGVYLVQGKTNDALKLIRRVDFSKFSGNEFLSDLIAASGMVMCQLGLFDEIEPLCQELLHKEGIQPKDIYFSNIVLATIYEEKGKLDSAEKYAEAAKKHIDTMKTEHIKKEWLVAYYRSIARISVRRENPHKAISLLTEFINSFGEEKDTSFFLSGVYTDRGLCYSYYNDIISATSDFNKAEEMLIKNNMPPEAFLILYNNIAINFEKQGLYTQAKEYLEKIVAISPNVLTPKTHFEAIVCGNIGWVYNNLNDFEQAIPLLKRSISALDALGMNNTTDYYKTQNNLAIVYFNQERYETTYGIYCDMRKTYTPSADPTGDIAIKANMGIIFCLLTLDKANKAYDFACEELKNFEKWFGETSSIRVTAILQMGGLFRQFGYQDCYDFIFLADEIINETEDFKSLNYAKLLNYVGLYLTDEENNHLEARSYFEESKELFEELNATEDIMYPVVVQNIDYVNNLIMDNLIGDLAKSVLDETKED